MAQMNKNMKLPQIQKIMMEFEKQVCSPLSSKEWDKIKTMEYNLTSEATCSIISPLSVSRYVRPYVRNAIDLGNRSKDFPETWHEVGGTIRVKNSRALFLRKNYNFAQIWPNLPKNCHFWPKSQFSGHCEKSAPTNFLKLHLSRPKNSFIG